jgi:predicted esterase
MKKIILISIVLLACIYATSASTAQWCTNANSANDLVYIPKNLSKTTKYPLLVILSPSGNPRSHIKLIAPAAEKHQWIIVGDDCFKNGQPFEKSIPHIMQTIQKAQSSYPVDPNRIYAGGLSGGAMGSYYLAFMQPQLIRGIIANTGMMPFASDPPHNQPMPTNFPRSKPIVMLASPTDFRYQAMKNNKATLESLGWRVNWIEFQGGHTFAPAQCYETAIGWLSIHP